MKNFFQACFVGLATWILFRAVYLFAHGNSVSSSLKNATGAPARMLGATTAIVGDPKKSAAAAATLQKSAAAVQTSLKTGAFSYTNLQKIWSDTIAQIYGAAATDANSTSQNAATVLPVSVALPNSGGSNPIGNLMFPSTPADVAYSTSAFIS